MSRPARRSPRRLLRLAGLLLGLWSAASPGDGLVTEVIPLRHRLVEDVLPILQPLMPPGSGLSGMGDQLIARTTPEHLEELRRVLGSLDRPLARLLITARIGRLADVRRSGVVARARVEVGGEDGSVRLGADGGRAAPRGGVAIDYDDGSAAARVRTWDTRALEDGREDYRVQTVEGQVAYIDVGQSVPLADQQVYVGPGGAVVTSGVQYRDVTSGVRVRPRVNGEQVTLEVLPKRQRLSREDAGVIETESAQTVVVGTLGEWMEVGGSSVDVAQRSGGTLRSTRELESSSTQLLVKVERLP